MNQRYQALAASLAARFGDTLQQVDSICDELTYEVEPDDLLATCETLLAAPEFGFESLVDLCGVDYLLYGESEWQTNSASNSGFSRGVSREVIIPDPEAEYDARRFAVVGLPGLLKSGNPQVGNRETTQAGLRLGPAAGSTFVADFPTGAGGRSGKR
jgi:NADH:ubiquinone oxidoreductase subunit C